MVLIKDSVINDLIACQKILNEPIHGLNYTRKHQFTRSVEAETELSSEHGEFKLRIRINPIIENDFSVILFWRDQDRKWRILTRYNGNSHTHTNVIEENDISFVFHKHRLTERYQTIGKEEDYVEVATDYNNLETAINCIMHDCNISYSRRILDGYM
jgi:hypothetical protein